jgi:hypothetical protein
MKNYQQILFCFLIHSHCVRILVVQHAQKYCQKRGTTLLASAANRYQLQFQRDGILSATNVIFGNRKNINFGIG